MRHHRDTNWGAVVTYVNNTFSKGYQTYASQVIQDYYGADGNPTVDVYGSCSDITKLWPYVVDVELFNKDGEKINTIGHGSDREHRR